MPRPARMGVMFVSQVLFGVWVLEYPKWCFDFKNGKQEEAKRCVYIESTNGLLVLVARTDHTSTLASERVQFTPRFSPKNDLPGTVVKVEVLVKMSIQSEYPCALSLYMTYL